ncbi:Clp protease ClpP [Rhodobacter sp. NTK016B]|uniref:head maturation protease, ClpP-related n=1 Tax=Rhodobacter sp. NTK016B TaxID=2759676 RepID=UPI001A8F7A38|nr:head maturation protease, ClpP-related [Rhodobacter sp. NTK016B]MBN8294953.1 Clp protease ClpP [Rhodobacter sp. NTK016B]
MNGEIYLEGSVGMAFWPDEPHFTPTMVREQLAGKGDVTVYLNSGGGIAADGLAIYHLLKDHPGAVAIVVTGVAVSAASLVAMAGDTITMREGTMLMIHDPAVGWTEGRGTEDDHRAIADYLQRQSEGYAEIYADRAGISADEARDIMRAETWFTPNEAIAAGFADALFEEAPKAAAAFPYRVYEKAPQQLLSGSRAGGPTKKAVLAMMRGGAAPTPKEAPMPKTNAAEMADDEDEILATESGEDETDATMIDDEEDDQTEAEDEGDEEDDDEAGADSVAILDLVAMHGGSVATARQFIADRTPLAAVVAHYREKGPSVTKHKPGGSTARITRDERDTRRAGMTEALAAQIGRRAPTDDRARPFMAMSLVELAAMSSGHRGPMRTAYDREQVFMAMHTTSDFPLALQNALNKELEGRYREATPTYRRIARQKSFRDFRPHPQVRPGDFPTLQPVGEGGEIKYGTIGEKAETVALAPYGIALSISRQTLINDDIGAIADMIADQGRAVARFEDSTFYAMLLSGSGSDGPTLLETSRKVFNTTDGTKAGTAAAITVASLSVGRAAMMKQKTLGGHDLGILPSILLVGPDKLTEAQQVVAPIQAAQAGNVNPFAGTLEVIGTAKITGNAWYLFADPADLPNFVYGYLEGATAPRTRMEEPFGMQGMRLSLEHDFGVGAIDFRGGYKNAGA